MESEVDDSGEATVIITGDYDDDIPGTQLTVVHNSQIIEATSNQEDNSNVSTSSKSKYYKQTYRTAWENMPDFKGWLRGVPGEPNRAFCVFCQKTLHAHRLSLLKHTCTMRHQKAAQIHQARKGNKQQANYELLVHKSGEDGATLGEIIIGQEEDDDHELDEDALMAEEMPDGVELDQEEEDEDEEETLHLENIDRRDLPYHQQLRAAAQVVFSPISTHVIDTTRGANVQGLQVSLYKLIDGRWTYINEGCTTVEGRYGQFVEASNFSTGRYKLHYDVDRYFESRKQMSIYPFIEVVFDCHNIADRFHMCLLISPFSYTSYRGTY